jgi:hypothetical protein
LFVGNCSGAVFKDLVELLGFRSTKKVVDLLNGVVVGVVAGVCGGEH